MTRKANVCPLQIMPRYALKIFGRNKRRALNKSGKQSQFVVSYTGGASTVCPKYLSLLQKNIFFFKKCPFSFLSRTEMPAVAPNMYLCLRVFIHVWRARANLTKTDMPRRNHGAPTQRRSADPILQPSALHLKMKRIRHDKTVTAITCVVPHTSQHRRHRTKRWTFHCLEVSSQWKF